MTRFLVPMDFSKEAYLALDWSLKLAQQLREHEVFLLTVGPLSLSSTEEGELKARLHEVVQDLRQSLTHPIELYGFYRSGRVPEEIRDFAKAEKIDLVVMTTRGRFGQVSQQQGSITEETVRLVACPILVLHMNQATVEEVKRRFEGFFPRREEPPAL